MGLVCVQRVQRCVKTSAAKQKKPNEKTGGKQEKTERDGRNQREMKKATSNSSFMEDPSTSASLAAVFYAALKQHSAWERGEGIINEVLTAWEHCDKLLEAARPAFFSRNERLDDFNTSSLK
jgi:hypothetical protein